MPCIYRKPTVESVDEGGGESFTGHIPFPSDAQLNRALEPYVPQLDAKLGFKQIIRNNVFPRISEILQTYGKGEWSLRPRTFTILRMLGCMDLMDSFVDEGRLDIFLPYNEHNLPETIKGEENRKRFLELQDSVLPPDRVDELESGGEHVHFGALADDYFPSMRPLDQGEFSTVDHVWSSLSLCQYARKRIHRGRSSKEDKNRLGLFENELKAIKKLSYRHIVKLVGSYTDPHWVGLIMTPVADADLEKYLTMPNQSRIQKQCLRTFFGCLTMAMGYLHRHNMCHGDVKPRNVLVKNGNVLLTDFGTTRFWEDDGRSTTISFTAFTMKYCAPEVIDRKPRGRPSDIWSLGCVFLEMATVLCDSTLQKMKDFYETEGTQGPYMWNNQDATLAWINKLKTTSSSPADTKPLEWISWMLKYAAIDRPVINQVQGAITDAQGEHVFMCRDCVEETLEIYPCNDMKAQVVAECLDGAHCPPIGEVTTSENDGIVTASMLGIPERSAKKMEVATEKDKTTPPKKVHFKQEAPPSPAYELPAYELRPNEESRNDGAFSNAIPAAPEKHLPPTPPLSPQVSQFKPVINHSPDNQTPKSTQSARTRFGLLPEALRPSAPSDPLEEEDEDYTFPVPEPLPPPPLHSADCFPLPKSTLSPSYVLAGCNHFSQDEINSATRYSRTNLFVYGGLMFPHILNSIASKSIKGVYSPIQQRRLYPTTDDWARADESIKTACSNMTPARLRGYDRWRVSKLDWAVIQDHRMTRKILRAREARNYYPINPEPPGEVLGYLILGITEEALRYIDMLLAMDSSAKNKKEKEASKEESDESDTDLDGGSKILDPADRPLQRQTISVDVELENGQMTTVDATTYVYAHGIKDVRGVWTPERFLQSKKARELQQEEKVWRTEEQILASTMEISYAMTGDYLCSTITTRNYDELKRLLEDHFDPNGACKVYGYPLQAASCIGNKDMVRLLLDYGADVNLVGGRYQTPLIAATIASRKSIIEQLLKARANVLADGGVYVNALYQAVGRSDWATTEMLLERGAWLDSNYREIIDLARERHDEEILDLLARYDWRRQCRRAIAYAKQERRQIQGGELEAPGQLVKFSRILVAVVKEFMVLQTEAGSWRGHKLVSIIKTAIEAGAPPSIVNLVKNAMEPVAALVHLLKEADRRENDERRRAIEGEKGEKDQDESGNESDESNIEEPRREPKKPVRRDPERPCPEEKPKSKSFPEELSKEFFDSLGTEAVKKVRERRMKGGQSYRVSEE